MINHKQRKTIVPETERNPVTYSIAQWCVTYMILQNAKVAARQDVACVLQMQANLQQGIASM